MFLASTLSNGVTVETITLSGTTGSPNDQPSSTQSSPQDAEAGWTFASDGTVSYYEIIAGNTTFQSGVEWCNQTPGQTYYIRATSYSGDAPDTGPAMFTWNALTTTRTWTWQVTGASGTSTGVIKVDISTDSGGDVIVATGYYSGYAEVTL